MSTVDITMPGRLSFDSAGIRMTPEEFDAIDDWDELYRYELIDGVFIVSPYPVPPHEGINEFLGNLLFLYKREHAEAPLDGTLTGVYLATKSNTRRCPDRVIWTGLNRHPNPRTDLPSIVVEIVSPGKKAWQRDYLLKRDEYLAAGVREYWIIDRFGRTMTVHRLSDAGPLEITVHEDESYTTNLLPGFELPLHELLAAADEWEDES